MGYKCPDDLKGKIIFYLKYMYKNPFRTEKEQLSIQEKINIFTDGSHIGAQKNRLSDTDTVIIEQNLDNSDEKIDALIFELNKIINICKNSNIKLTIVLTPQHSQKMSKFNPADIKTFKKRLSEISDYYDFWTDNQISENKNAFNANNFITFETAKKLSERIFSEDKKNPETKNFGIYVKKGKYDEK